MNLIQNSFDLIKIYSNINKIKRKIKYNIKIKYKKIKLKNLSIDANIKSAKNLKKNISCKSEYYRAISQKKIALNIFTLKNNNYSIKNIQKEKLQTNENINKAYKKILIQNLVGKIKKFISKKIMNLFINKLKQEKLKTKLEKINDFYNKKNFFSKWKETLLKNKIENIEFKKTLKKYDNFFIKVNKKPIKDYQNYLKKLNNTNSIYKLKIKKFLEKLLKISKLKTFKILLYYKKNINQKFKKNKKHIYKKEKYMNNFNFNDSQKK
jgi:hypothetical protein